MDVTPLIPQGRQIIDGYGDSGFRISGQRVEGSVIVFPDHVASWTVHEPADVNAASLAAVIAAAQAGSVDLLLIGTGARMTQIARTLRQELKAEGVVVEAMDTGAACRTYNVLMAEGRRVAAALIAVA